MKDKSSFQLCYHFNAEEMHTNLALLVVCTVMISKMLEMHSGALLYF